MNYSVWISYDTNRPGTSTRSHKIHIAETHDPVSPMASGPVFNGVIRYHGVVSTLVEAIATALEYGPSGDVCLVRQSTLDNASTDEFEGQYSYHTWRKAGKSFWRSPTEHEYVVADRIDGKLTITAEIESANA
jgi:hypothetical protein